MGTDYYFLCLDCKEYWDMGKIPGVARFLPTLKEKHKNHRAVIYSDQDEMSTLLSPYNSIYWEVPYTRKDCYKDEELRTLPPATEGKINRTIPEVCARDSKALDWAYNIVISVIREHNPGLEDEQEQDIRKREEEALQIRMFLENNVGIVKGVEDDPEADKDFLEAFKKAKEVN